MRVKFTSILSQCIYGIALCLGTLNASEDRLTRDDLLKIEEERLLNTPKEILEQTQPKLNYYNDYLYIDKIHKLAYTFPVSLINGGQGISLIDGSVWLVHPIHRYQVHQWVQEHILFIKPNVSWFSKYNYVLYNRNTYQAIEVLCDHIPNDYNFYKQRIEKIDFYNRIVQLDDAERTIWQINFANDAFNFWTAGDYIMVGVNNDWRIASYPHILINASIPGAPYCEANLVHCQN